MIAVALGLLRGVSPVVWVVAAALAWGAWQRHAAHAADAALASELKKTAELREAAYRGALLDAVRIRDEQKEVSDEAARMAARVRADDVARGTADGRLRDLVAATAGRACTGPAAAAGIGPAASSPADLLANVQRRMAEAAGQLVRFADDAAIAGTECAGDYESLRKKTKP